MKQTILSLKKLAKAFLKFRFLWTTTTNQQTKVITDHREGCHFSAQLPQCLATSPGECWRAELNGKGMSSSLHGTFLCVRRYRGTENNGSAAWTLRSPWRSWQNVFRGLGQPAICAPVFCWEMAVRYQWHLSYLPHSWSTVLCPKPAVSSQALIGSRFWLIKLYWF